MPVVPVVLPNAQYQNTIAFTLLCRYGKPLRVAEMNTISNSGREGVSNVFAAALWTLDASLEVAAAGGIGVNFHQGAGQNLYAAIIRW
jgi:hypothetical protein